MVSALLSNIILLLLAIIVFVFIIAYIINGIRKGFKKPFVVIKEWIQNSENEKKAKKILSQDQKIKDLEAECRKNKDLIKEINIQLKDLSRIFDEIIRKEGECSKYMNELEQKEKDLEDLKNIKNKLIRFFKRLFAGININNDIKKLNEKIYEIVNEIDAQKEQLRSRMEEMLKSLK
jgi:chromosome segregation ATPase